MSLNRQTISISKTRQQTSTNHVQQLDNVTILTDAQMVVQCIAENSLSAATDHIIQDCKDLTNCSSLI